MRTELSLSDEWETPKELFEYLCYKYRFFPILDVCATKENSKCYRCYTKEDNGLFKSWCKKNWCNPPHSEIERWVKKAYKEFLENNSEIMMIIPANSITTIYSELCIWDIADICEPIFERPKFLRDGKQLDSAKSGYFVIIWRKWN